MADLSAYEPIYWATLRTLNTKGATMAAGDVPMATAAEALGAVVSNGFSNRNLLYNGEMKVPQRGTSIAAVNATAYTLDGWIYENQGTGPGVVTASQSTTVPNSSFASSLKLDVTTIDGAIAAGDYYAVAQKIEGLRCNRIGFGTANAKTLTLSFWIRVDSASLVFPATFTGSFQNSAQNRSYPFSFSVTATATWQQISVTLTGDQTGTWLQTNGIGLWMHLSLACGSTYQGAAAAWAGADTRGVSTQVNFMADAANDLYMTGVQLEVGATATPFEFKPYGQDLLEAQRYYWRQTRAASGDVEIAGGYVEDATNARFPIRNPVPMRTTPSLTTITVANLSIRRAAATTALSSIALTAGGPLVNLVTATVAAGLTGGQGVDLFFGSDGDWLAFSAEL
jgi:hypothetical protein